jgi:hypothetical protein
MFSYKDIVKKDRSKNKKINVRPSILPKKKSKQRSVRSPNWNSKWRKTPVKKRRNIRKKSSNKRKNKE